MRPVSSRVLVLVYLFVVLTFALIRVASSQTQSRLRRDETAVLTLSKAIDALGGSAAWSQVSDTAIQGICAVPGVSTGSDDVRSQAIWITQGREFRYQAEDGNESSVYLSGHGHPKVISAFGTHNLAFEYGERRLPFQLPGLILPEFLTKASDYAVSVIGTETIDNAETLHIQTLEFHGSAKIQGAQQDWWFDSSSGLPVQVEYLLPAEDNSHYTHLSLQYGRWTKSGLILVPLQQTLLFEGQIVLQSCDLQLFQTNLNPSTATFETR